MKASSVAALFGLTAVSFLVRVRSLDVQILGGDELHLLQVITSQTPSTIVGLVTDTDFSIPLALLLRGLSALWPLTEWGLRLPVLLVGSFTPAILFLGVRRVIPEAPAGLLSLIVLGHPLFIFYSRFLRPYGLCVVLVFLVFLLLLRVHRSARGGFWSLALVSVLAALSSWIHLVSLISVAWLFLTAFLSIFVFRQESKGERCRETSLGHSGHSSEISLGHSAGKKGARIRRALGRGISLGRSPGKEGARILGFGFFTLLLTCVLYSPALSGLREQILQDNLGQGGLTSEVLWRNASILSGWPGKSGALVLTGLACTGAFLLLVRRKPHLLFWILMPVAGQVITLIVLNPRLLYFSFVLARYLFYVLPFVLLLAAIGLDAVIKFGVGKIPLRERQKSVVAFLVGVLLISLGLWFGPYRRIYDGSSSFSHHNVFQTFSYLQSPRWLAASERSYSAPIPPLYRQLGAEDELLVEGPPANAFFDNVYAYYQWFHARPVVFVAPADSFWGSPRLKLKNVVILGPSGPSRQLPSGTKVVLHRSMLEEISLALGHPPSLKATAVFSKRMIETLSLELRKLCGPAVQRDKTVEVYIWP